MGCFVVPAGEAVVTTVIEKIVEHKEKKALALSMGHGAELTDAQKEMLHTAVSEKMAEKTPFSRKMKWLNNMLWGGSFLLAFEHVWHGEVVPYFPFFSAMSTPESTAVMLREMSTTGVMMAVTVTAVWGIMVAVSSYMESKVNERDSAEQEA